MAGNRRGPKPLADAPAEAPDFDGLNVRRFSKEESRARMRERLDKAEGRKRKKLPKKGAPTKKLYAIKLDVKLHAEALKVIDRNFTRAVRVALGEAIVRRRSLRPDAVDPDIILTRLEALEQEVQRLRAGLE